MSCGGGSDAGDRIREGLGTELARQAEGYRKVEMANPKAVDAGQRGDGVGVLDALACLDLAEERTAAIGGRELVLYRAGSVAIVSDLKSDAAAAFAGIFHRV